MRLLSLQKNHKSLFPSVILVLTMLLFVSGCTTALRSSEPDSPSIQQQSLDDIPDSWTINGRISVINGQENWYAKFIWLQKKQDFQLSFTGPLGETELQISRIAENVHLKTPSTERSGQNLEQLLQQETGWLLPVSSLRFWSQGFADPDMSSKMKYNEEQQISDIFQAGWHIRYPEKTLVEQLSGETLLLPKKIIATKQAVKIKLIITRWQLGEASFSFH